MTKIFYFIICTLELYNTNGGLQEVHVDSVLIQFWHFILSHGKHIPDLLKYRAEHY